VAAAISVSASWVNAKVVELDVPLRSTRVRRLTSVCGSKCIVLDFCLGSFLVLSVWIWGILESEKVGHSMLTAWGYIYLVSGLIFILAQLAGW